MRPWYIHLTLPRESLRARIAARVDAMLAAGLVEEVRAVLARGVAPDAAGLDGVGYREVVAMLVNGTRLPAPELRDAIAAATRSYAKRQETWFRNQLRDAPVWTLDATEEPAVLASLILERWQSAAPS
jgi:tRNA dimethylallyltransferase